MNDLLDFSDETGQMDLLVEQSNMISRFNTVKRPNSKSMQLKSWFCKDSLVEVFKSKYQLPKTDNKSKIESKSPSEIKKPVSKMIKNTISQPMSSENSAIYLPSTHRHLKVRPPLKKPLMNIAPKELAKVKEVMQTPMTFDRLITQLKAPFIAHPKTKSYGSVPAGLTKNNVLNNQVFIPQVSLTKTNIELRKEQALLTRKKLEAKRRRLIDYYQRSSIEPDHQRSASNHQSPPTDRRPSVESSIVDGDAVIVDRCSTSRFRLKRIKAASISDN